MGIAVPVIVEGCEGSGTGAFAPATTGDGCGDVEGIGPSVTGDGARKTRSEDIRNVSFPFVWYHNFVEIST